MTDRCRLQFKKSMSSQVSHDAFRTIFPRYAELLSEASLPGNESIETFLREELPRKVELVRNMEASFNAFLAHFTTAILKRPQHSHLIHSLILKASDKIEKYFHHLSLVTHKIDQADLKERLACIDLQYLKRDFRSKLESTQGLLREKYFGGGFIERECEEEIAMRLYVLLELYHFLKGDPVTIAGKFRLREQEVLWAVSKNEQPSDISGLINLDAVFLATLQETVQKRCRPFSNKRELLDSKVREVLREGESRVGPNINLLLQSLISKERVRISRELGNSLGRQLREIPQCEGQVEAKQMIGEVQLLKRQFAQLKNTTYFLDIMRGSFSEKYKMQVNRLENVFYLTNLQKFLQDVSTFLEKVLALEERLIHNRRDYMRDFGNAIEIRISDLIDSYGSKANPQGLSEIIQGQFELLESALYGIVSKPAVKQQYTSNYQKEDREGERRRQLQIKAQEERERKEAERIKLEERRRKDEERLQQARQERQEKERRKRQQNERLDQERKAQLQRKRQEKARKDDQNRRQKEQQQLKRDEQDKVKREQQNRKRQQEQQKKKRQRDEEMRRRDEQKKKILERQEEEKRKRQGQLKQRRKIEQQEKLKRQRERKAEEERIKREKEEREAEQRRKQEDRLRAERQKRQRQSKEGEQRRKEQEKQKRQRQQREKQQREAQQRKKQQEKARIEKEKKERQLREAEEKQRRERQRRQRQVEEKRRQEDKLKAERQKKQREKKLEQQRIAKEREQKTKKEQEEKQRLQKEKREKEQRQRRDRQERQRKEKEERERKEKEKRDKEQKDRKEKQQRQKKEKLEKERKEKEEKQRREKQERQRKEKEQRQRKQREQREKKEKLQKQKRQKQERQRKQKEQKEKKQKLQRQKRQKEQKERIQKEKKLKEQRQAEERMRKQEEQRLKRQQQMKNKAVKKPQPKKSSGINYGEFDDDDFDDADIDPVHTMQRAGNNKASKIESQIQPEADEYADDFDEQSPQKPGQIETKELIGPNDIKCLNDYMKGTTYARKNKPNAELLNKENVYIMLFEELVQNKKIFVFSGPISKAMLDLGGELANPDTLEDDLRMSVETIKQEMFRVYDEIFGGQEMELTTRFVFPFPFKNEFNLRLIELVPAHCYFQVVFQQAMDEDEQIQNHFRGVIEGLLHIFQLQGEPSIEEMVVGQESKLVLGTFERQLPPLLLLFARHYQQQNAPQVLINQYTIERFFYTAHPIEPLYEAIKDDEINEFYEKLSEKFSVHDKIKIHNVQVTSGDEHYANTLISQSQRIKAQFMKSKQQSFLCCFSINLVNEENQIQDKISVYLSLDRASPKSVANYFLVSKDAEEQENASLIFEYASQGDEAFEVNVYTDFSRHNGLSEYGDWALPLWAHTTIKRKLSTLQAMRAIAFAMTPFYLAFKEMD